jgi:hypothetical protein
MPAQIDRELYVQRVLGLYRLLPGSTGHIRRSDRQLAGSLHDREISLQIVSAAMILTAARRTFRSGDPLPPISSFHYLRPVIDELLARPVDLAYISYLWRKLVPVAPDFAAVTAHHLP